MHTPESRRAAKGAAALAALVGLAALFFYAHVRAAGATYYSRGSLPPELVTSWSSTRDGLGTPPPSFAAGDAFVIQDGHTMTTAAAWNISGPNSKLQIENGGTLDSAAPVMLSAATTFRIDDGGTYKHDNTSGMSGTIFAGIESFASNSNFIYLKATGATQVSGVTYGNLTYDIGADPGSSLQYNGGLTTVNGNLSVVRVAGDREIRLGSGSTYTLNIAGNLSVSGGVLSFNSGSGGTQTINVGGSWSQTGGTIQGAAGPATVNFTGGSPFVTFKRSGGTLTNNNINWSIAAGKTVEFDSAFTNAASRTLAVGAGGALVAAAAVVNNGTTAVNGEFRLKGGGSAAGNGFVYGASSTLAYDTGSAYTAGVEFPAAGVRNLTLASTTQLTLDGDKAVTGAVSLGSGRISTGSSFALTLGGSATLTRADGYVVGALKKVSVPADFTFHVGTAAGYTPLEVSNASGGGDLSVRAVGAAHPAVNASTSLKEHWSLNATGSLTLDMTFNYLQPDVQGNESVYRVVRVSNGAAGSFPPNCPAGTCVDAAGNTAVVRAVSPSSSDWTLDEPGPLTLARLVGFRATATEGGTVLEWKTGYEVENLGFNLYRESAGRLAPVNASLVAGSALVAGPGVALTAGNSYSWTDAEGDIGARYWLEEVDLAGRATRYGPFEAVRGVAPFKGARSPLVSQLVDPAPAAVSQRQWTQTDADAALLTRASRGAPLEEARARQRWLASQPAVKISVRETGWYVVAREQ
ncbi:MAG TPA: hypothetical protein VF736_22185, partial [Pyrinomonadaceae bacterium]